MTEIIPQYSLFKIKLVVSDSILCIFVFIYYSFIYLLKTSIVVYFARQMLFYTSNSFITTFTFLFETQFRDAIQSADSNDFSIERKSKLRGKL